MIESNQKLSALTPREKWVDIVKGISILCIMWQHCSVDSPIHNCISSFSVTSFLVVTGYLLSQHNRIENANMKKDLRRYFTPYAFFSVLAIIFEFLYLVYTGSLINDIIKCVSEDTYKTLTGFGYYALWFIPSFFIAKFVFVFLKKRIKKNVYIFMLYCFVAVVAILYSNGLTVLKQNVSDVVYYSLYYPTASIVRGMVCSFYVFCGYLLSGTIDTIKSKFNKWLILFIAIVLFAINYFIAQLCAPCNSSMVSYGQYPTLVLANSLVGAAAIVLLSIGLYKFLPIEHRLISFLGRNSIIIMVTHMSLKLHIIIPKLTSLVMNCNHYIVELLNLLILTTVEIGLIYVINKYCGFMLGRKRLFKK